MTLPAVRSLPWLLLGVFGAACALGPGIDVPAKGDGGGFESDGSAPTDDVGVSDDGSSLPGSSSGGAASGGAPAGGGSGSGGASSLGGSEPVGGTGSQAGAAGARSDG